MLRFMIPLMLITLSATARSVQERSSLPRLKYSAASESQINFAIENKYDDTGPGAKQPENAYKTYTTLDDALVAYLDDPDTKLPEEERAKAEKKLFANQPQYHPREEIQRYYPKTVEEYTGYKKTQIPQLPSKYIYKEKNVPAYFQRPETKYIGLGAYDGKDFSLFKASEKRPAEPFRLKKIHAVKGSPLSLAHYTRDADLEQSPPDQFNSQPKYTFSYGVHNAETGDSKSAHETREGGTVHGYYSFMDPDGKQRIVHYTADDKLGFRATVQRTGADE